MSIQSYIKAWDGDAVRHIPKLAAQQYDIYDFSYAARSAENRWNRQGEPTFTLPLLLPCLCHRWLFWTIWNSGV